LRDITIINTELIFADLQTIENKMHDIDRRIKAFDPDAQEQKSFFSFLESALIDGKLVSELLS
jgi:ribosome-binding ATPase YchF (GTP1/OBG family)